MWLALGAVAVYLIVKAKGFVQTNIANPLATGIANLVVGSSTMQAQGRVIFPDGSSVPMSSLQSGHGLRFDAVSNAGVFTLNGNTWYITGQSDAQGNWHATTGGFSPAAYNPNAAGFDANTPFTSSTIASPVSALTSILPYSYKQSVVDTPAVLGTNDLFMPSYDSGSAGSYADPSSSDYGSTTDSALLA